MTALKMIWRVLAVTGILIVLSSAGAGAVYADQFATYSIPVTCRISPDIPVDMDLDFTYTLRAENGDCPMPEGADGEEKTVHMTDSGAVEFGKITFDHPDVFHYTLQETTAETGSFRRDRTEYSAALIADTDGNVRMVVNTDKGKKPEKIEFANSYDRAVKNEGVPRTGDASVLWKYMILLIAGAAGLMAAGHKATEQKAAEAGLRSVSGSRSRSVIIALMLAVLWSCDGQVYAAVDAVSNYSALPVNNVEITSLNFNNVKFTSLNSKIERGSMQYYISGESITNTTIYWVSTAPPKFGTSDATATQNASLAYNSVSGDLFTLRFEKAATLSDGSKKDVLMTFSDLYFGLSKNINNITGSKYYYPLIRITDKGSANYCNSGVGTGTKNSARITGVRSATRIKTTIRIVEPATNDCVDEMAYILGFRDLDVRDHTTATGDNIDRYAGRFSEGIGLISGYEEPVYLTADTHVKQQTVDSVTKLRGSQREDGGMQGGFDIPVLTSGFSYYWYGSQHIASNNSNPGGAVGTAFGYSPKVNVFASAGNGGTIEKPGVTNYLVNASTTYKYTPSDGYKVRKLVVDGKGVPFEKDGGTYVFSKLTESGTDGYDHTIEVTFQKPQDILITKNVKGSLGDLSKEFEFEVSLSKLEGSTEYHITEDSTGNFYDVSDGTRLSSKRFRSSSGGSAVLKLKLKSGQFVRLQAITEGARYSVKEGKNDHTALFTVAGNGSAPVIADRSGSNTSPGALNTGTETVDEGDGLVRVAFTNQRDLAVPTGVKMRQAPFIVVLAIAALMGILHRRMM